jgi:hypothetical protein
VLVFFSDRIEDAAAEVTEDRDGRHDEGENARGHAHEAAHARRRDPLRLVVAGFCRDLQGLRRMLPGGAKIHDCGLSPLPPRPPELRGFAALRFLWEEVLVPLAEAMAPGDPLDPVDYLDPVQAPQFVEERRDGVQTDRPSADRRLVITAE